MKTNRRLKTIPAAILVCSSFIGNMFMTSLAEETIYVTGGDSEKTASEVDITGNSNIVEADNNKKYLKFNTSADRSFYSIYVKNLSYKGLIRFYLMNSDMETVARKDWTIASDGAQWNMKLKPSSTYYLLADCLKASEPGNFKFVVSESKDAVGDVETESTELALNGVVNGSIDGENDSDYYTFKTAKNANTYYTLTYKNISVEGSTDIYLSDATGEKVWQGRFAAKNDTRTVNMKLKSDMTYYVQVTGSSWTSADYKISTATREDLQGDSEETPVWLSKDKMVDAAIDGEGDQDYFRFTAPSAGSYIFYTQGKGEKGVDVKVINDKGEELYKNAYYKDEYTNKVFTLERGQTVYIVAEGSEVSPYRLKVEKYSKPGKVKSAKAKKVKNKTRTYKVSWKAVKGADGYQIDYGKNKKFKDAENVDTTKKSSEISLKPGTYYVRVRAYRYIDNVKLFGKASKTVKIKVK